MKVVAVVPARAESKIIPNRNLRFVNGKPLVYYAINTANKSELISEVIVTTDSTEVKIIAEQMGAKVRKRDKALTADSVTLDTIIFDAVRDTEADYIVMLQPTSPTLKVETLNEAIKYAIEHDLDNLISVVNDPELAWTRNEEGKLIPLFTERVNRAYLPAHYVESGSFLIRKMAAIRGNQSAVYGEKTDIFETSWEEAIEIHNFYDLQQAENIMSKKKVAIYVNGNNTRGVGHIYRSLELADEFYTEPDIYYDINQTDRSVFGATTHNLIPVNGIGELLLRVKDIDYDIFINDILTTSIDYMIALKTSLPKAKIINFEDDGEGIFKADLVINSLYGEETLPQVRAGEKYYIANKLFMFYEPVAIKDKVKEVFVSFGGADPQNYSDRLLAFASKEEYRDYHFTVVLGRAKLNVENLMEYNKYDNITVLYDVKNMPELMSHADIAVTSRGRTGYELAILGIPSIAMAQNQREEKHGFVCNENGFTYIGLNPADEIIESNLKMYLGLSKKSRQHFQDMLLSHDLRGGRKRVMGMINNL